MRTPYLEKLKSTFCHDSWNVAVYIWLKLCHMLTDFNNFCSDETAKMYETGHTFTYLLLKESVSIDVINVSFIVCLLWTMPSTSGGIVCWPVSTMMANILNITDDCCSQNNNVKMAALQIWLLEMTFSVLFCCERKWTKNNSVFNWKVFLFKFTK